MFGLCANNRQLLIAANHFTVGANGFYAWSDFHYAAPPLARTMTIVLVVVIITFARSDIFHIMSADPLGRTRGHTALVCKLTLAIGDSALGKIIRGQLNRHAVSGYDSYVVFTHLTGDVGYNDMAVFKLNFELGAW